MKVELREILVKDVFAGYINNDEEEFVSGYNGKLNIRPKYQRNFVYKDQQRDSVIKTVRAGFPLNVMYWASNVDDSYEVIDGQQRTISICEYMAGKFSIDEVYFFNLTEDQQESIRNYKLMVYFCEGSDSEKLAWFKTINIAGEKLTDQELRNAIYPGPWLSHAKNRFSRKNCPAASMCKDYVKGAANRQEILETAISWIIQDKPGYQKIETYMAKHCNDESANELWLHFEGIINWVKLIFPNYRSEMKSVNWGELYSKAKSKTLNAKTLELEVLSLMKDEDVTNKSGIYAYVLTKEEKHLNIRAFSDNMKREAYERQSGLCLKCNPQAKFDYEKMEGDHITPWSQGGKTNAANCQMLCKGCNRTKSAK